MVNKHVRILSIKELQQCNCCHSHVTVTNHSSCHDRKQMKMFLSNMRRRRRHYARIACFLFYLLFFFFFLFTPSSSYSCCFVFVVAAVLNLRKMAQRNKLKCSKSRLRRCRASFHSATSYHTTQYEQRGERSNGVCGGGGGIVATCHGMTATITKSHCYRRRNNKRATKLEKYEK